MPVSKLAEINRRGENCTALDGSLSEETQATSYFLVKKLLDAGEMRVISRGTERLIPRSVKLLNKRPRSRLLSQHGSLLSFRDLQIQQ